MLTLDDVNFKMLKGSVLQKKNDPEILYTIASRGKTYVEIGTRWGGSAIIAGLAGCEVHCIDHWEYPGKQPRDQTTMQDVSDNWAHAELATAKLFMYQQRHPPWPEAIEDRRFDIGMIDGQHYVKEIAQDWEAMKLRVDKYILFHDLLIHWEVREVFAEAAEDPRWEIWDPPTESQFGVLKCVRSKVGMALA